MIRIIDKSSTNDAIKSGFSARESTEANAIEFDGIKYYRTFHYNTQSAAEAKLRELTNKPDKWLIVKYRGFLDGNRILSSTGYNYVIYKPKNDLRVSKEKKSEPTSECRVIVCSGECTFDNGEAFFIVILPSKGKVGKKIINAIRKFAIEKIYGQTRLPKGALDPFTVCDESASTIIQSVKSRKTKHIWAQYDPKSGECKEIKW